MGGASTPPGWAIDVQLVGHRSAAGFYGVQVTARSPDRKHDVTWKMTGPDAITLATGLLNAATGDEWL